MIKSRFDEIEELIRAGRVARASAMLKALNVPKLARDKLAVASLARRAGLPELTVKILNPVVRSQKPADRPSVAERALYAAGLSEIGATAEALELLAQIEDHPLPEISLYQASALFSQWRYREAIARLRRYLSFRELTPYQKLIGLVNLSAALIFEREDESARAVLAEAQVAARELKAMRLYGNCMELQGQLAILQGDFEEADRALGEAEVSLRDSGAHDELYVRKWIAIKELRRLSGEPRKQREPLRALLSVRKEAGQRRDWESVRDCDFHRAIGTHDIRLLRKVYQGTPFADYRRRLQQEAWEKLEIGEWIWRLGSGPKGQRVFDLALGLEKPGDAGTELRAGGLPHRLLEVLCRDFYRPWRPAALFSELFPDEYFHPVTSPDRVHKILRRLREWFVQSGVPLRVVEQKGEYALESSDSYAIRLTHRGGDTGFSREEVLLKRLRETRGSAREFSSGEVGLALGISERSAVRLLSWAVAQGRLERLGVRARTRYRFERYSKN